MEWRDGKDIWGTESWVVAGEKGERGGGSCDIFRRKSQQWLQLITYRFLINKLRTYELVNDLINFDLSSFFGKSRTLAFMSSAAVSFYGSVGG